MRAQSIPWSELQRVGYLEDEEGRSFDTLIPTHHTTRRLQHKNLHMNTINAVQIVVPKNGGWGRGEGEDSNLKNARRFFTAFLFNLFSFLNPLKTKRMCFIRTQCVPRCKHSPLRL
jgi:hypothetical protein